MSASAELKANVGSDTSWVHHAKDFSDNITKPDGEETTFAIRFKTTEESTRFSDAFTVAKTANGGDGGGEAKEDGAAAAAGGAEKTAAEEMAEQVKKDAAPPAEAVEAADAAKDDASVLDAAAALAAVKVEE